MNDHSSSAMRELQGLRLMRAFLRIDDAALRRVVIELTERLAEGAPAASPSAADDLSANVTPLHENPTLA
ncbi:hypothetical protein [Bradyrhizobium zhanjiangense]|uniref:hypothetical protein n=1 Tax=Bradyrhizobium zhanjiangense TaxID=1325107 RepID=UPI001008C0EF|nr:hypothetical protein [Bradyrhizobium zhanjiangense]